MPRRFVGRRGATLLRTTAATVAICVVYLWACSDVAPPERSESESDVATRGGDSMQISTVTTDSTALKACDLISETQLEAILALDLEPARTTNDYGGQSGCRWDLPGDPQRGVSLTLREHGDLSVYDRVPGGVAAPGLGDAAVWNAAYGQLAVRAGERVIAVALLVANPQRSQAERIVEAALERL